MIIILTHENADFDAVASQLAAHKLYPEGVPLLSWRLNRNVNQFLNLYWDAFDFVRAKDWQRQRIDRVVLVDTTALPSVRGLRADRVSVQVVDHHESPEMLPDGWSCLIEPVGATTTLLVEMLQEGGLNLTVTEANLLLMGIHEDTGSLIYDTTTARDAQAAAWLLDQGAQLSVVRRFLNISLSDEQQALYEQLLAAAEWIRIEGESVVLSSVAAPPDFEDEISAVAHRLRDALLPDGMFILVQLKHNHVQLVARSGSDRVDVSVIARALGGGGHSRAAAATIMDRDLSSVREQIVRLLPSIIKPMDMVSNIMSFGVQTLPASATVAEAAEQMKRSGHEGYPVVDPEGRLVGLLTRRIVDRAVSHKLEKLPVSQVMKAGQVTVQPSESVERVQRLMIKEGWGQIPVVADKDDPAGAGQIIGIVTRTDLINLLTSGASRIDGLDLRNLMSRSLSPAVWGMVQTVGEVAREMDMPLYFVGGLVRDLLLGKAAVDIDMVVEGDAIALVRRLTKVYGGGSRSHAQFGTAKWLTNMQTWQKVSPKLTVEEVPEAIDFVTARSEFYRRPSALPEVERGSIKLDLHRRDFTINTLAIRLDGAHLGELLDFYGGRRDLELGLVRVLHSLSFVDDATRILRAVRLEQRLGFSIEARTAELVEAALPMLDRVTGERIRNELEMCLRETSRTSIMERLDELGILAQIHPDFALSSQVVDSFREAGLLLEDSFWLNMLGEESPAFLYFSLLVQPLPLTVQREVMARLKVRKSTREDVLAVSDALRKIELLPATAPPSDVVKALASYVDRVLLATLAIVGPESSAGEQIQRYQREWRHVSPILNGNDLLEMGMKPGPEIGRLLDILSVARLDGQVMDESDERALVARHRART